MCTTCKGKRGAHWMELTPLVCPLQVWMWRLGTKQVSFSLRVSLGGSIHDRPAQVGRGRPQPRHGWGGYGKGAQVQLGWQEEAKHMLGGQVGQLGGWWSLATSREQILAASQSWLSSS